MRIVNFSTATAAAVIVATSSVALIPSVALAEGGLPQLDIATFPTQIVWLFITFTVLYILMTKVALPRVGEVLEERQNKIDDALGKAEDLNAKANAAAEAYEASLMDARAKAVDAIMTVREEANAESAAKHADLSATLVDQVKTAESAIAKAKDAAISNITDMSIEVAAAAVEKLIGEAPKDKAVTDAVSAVLKARA